MTQAELAARVGVAKSTVANWETDKHYPARYLGAVEAVLGVSLTDEPDGLVPHDEFERELLARKDAWPPGEAERMIRLYRERPGQRAG